MVFALVALFIFPFFFVCFACSLNLSCWFNITEHEISQNHPKNQELRIKNITQRLHCPSTQCSFHHYCRFVLLQYLKKEGTSYFFSFFFWVGPSAGAVRRLFCIHRKIKASKQNWNKNDYVRWYFHLLVDEGNMVKCAN